jgi:hypothetical protein
MNKDIVAIARQMIDRHGARAATVAANLAQDLADAGDRERAGFWFQVAEAVRKLQKEP